MKKEIIQQAIKAKLI